MKITTLIKEAVTAFNCKLLKVTSSAFKNEGIIPFKYSCDGANVNPPLDIEDIPEETRSLAVIFENRNASAGPWAHWVVWNIPVMDHIKEYGMHGTEGMNDFHQQRYIGPVPSFDTCQYVFNIYALNSLIYLTPQENKEALKTAMNEHIIAYGKLIGLYKNNLANNFRDNIAHHN